MLASYMPEQIYKHWKIYKVPKKPGDKSETYIAVKQGKRAIKGTDLPHLIADIDRAER